MLRTALVLSLLGSASAAALTDCGAASNGYCYGYRGKSWCWLTHDGLTDYVSQGDDGYRCRDYDGYSSNTYCKNAKKPGKPTYHQSKSHNTGGASSAASSGSSGSANTPWGKYLASLKGKSSLDWKAACKSLGQQPAGYGMGMSGGVTSYHLTCNDNKITVKCHGSPFTSCESSYKPPAGIADTPPPGKYNVGATATSCSANDALSQEDVQKFLNIHNKMRCAVGAEPVKWDGALACQAQQTQDKIGAFSHSDCYDLPIKSGENLATGTNVATAAWMWFLEYTQSTNYAHGGETGHYSAMSWKGVTHIGCGIQRSGKGVIRCQYRGSPLPNMGGSYGANLDKFYGRPAQFKKCGMPLAEIQSQAKMQAGWGILHPSGTMASNLGLYSMTDSIWAQASPSAFFSACAFVGAAAMISLGVAVHRWRRNVSAREAPQLLVVEDEGLE